jgi:hypothetical protein
MTTALQCICKFLNKPYTPAGFEPGIICSLGGRDDHAARADITFVVKKHWVTCGVVIIYSAGVVIRDRRIGSRSRFYVTVSAGIYGQKLIMFKYEF